MTYGLGQSTLKNMFPEQKPMKSIDLQAQEAARTEALNLRKRRGLLSIATSQAGVQGEPATFKTTLGA